MTIIISGGGTDSSGELTREFLNRVKGSKIIGVIANAREPSEYKSTIQWIDSKLFPKHHGCKLSLIDLNQDRLEQFDAIVIGGGNTFKLLKDMKNSGADKELIGFAKKAKPIYGISAGAIILGSNISTASVLDKNNIGLKDMSGLNLFKDTSFGCHYKDSNLENLKKYLGIGNSKIIALPEGSGIVYDMRESQNKVIGNVLVLER